ncbi:MAG: hypothetical protein AB1432_13645 [Bacteroidota bacterium]
MHNLIKGLFYFSIVLWLIPPIRQYKTNYFFFFLILAFIDPLVILYSKITFQNVPLSFYIFTNFLLFISLLDTSSIKRNWFLVFSGLVVLIGIVIYSNFTTSQSLIILIAIQFLILTAILKKFIVNFALNKKINLFHLVLILYILTIITKFFNVLTSFSDATAFFIITTIAQIIFGFYFSIVRGNNA